MTIEFVVGFVRGMFIAVGCVTESLFGGGGGAKGGRPSSGGADLYLI